MADSLLNQLFTVLDNETGKYALAESAIETSGLQVIREGAVCPLWHFSNFAEMVAYMFEYFSMQVEKDKVALMAEVLGDSRNLAPLAIEDKTRFWLLGVS